MANKYYIATNTGKGFITHEDQGVAQISGHPANIWVTDEVNSAWASRVGATEKTKEEAQNILDATLVDDSGNRLTVISSSYIGSGSEASRTDLTEDDYKFTDTGVLVTYELP